MTAPTGTTCSNATVIAGWTVDRLAAQTIVIPVLGGDLPSLTQTLQLGVGGVLLLGTPPGDLVDEVHQADAQLPGEPSLFVMADEEGGGVQRLGSLVPSLPWPRDMAATMTPAQVQASAHDLATAMLAAGVDVDLAPVADIDDGPGPDSRHPDGRRSFSGSPDVASTYAVAFMQGLQQGGVVSVLKHFPGLGGSTGNTDDGPAATPPVNAQSPALQPFEQAISQGARAVMVANATVPGVTNEPASISAPAVDGLLRQTLGFDGLVLTDSLSAGAISAAGDDVPTAAARALEAGADMILFGSTLTPAEQALLAPDQVQATTEAIEAHIVDEVDAQRLPRAQLEGSVLRILAAKRADLCAPPR